MSVVWFNMEAVLPTNPVVTAPFALMSTISPTLHVYVSMGFREAVGGGGSLILSQIG